MSSPRFQEESIKIQTNELKLSTIWVHIFHNGGMKPKSSIKGSAMGWMNTEMKDFMVCIIIRNHPTTFWKLCGNSIALRYLILNIVSQLFI